jgi:hypothetical protein
MTRTTAVITVLAIVLIGSNAWWAYRMIDTGVSYTYQQDSLHMNQEALAQTLEVLKIATQPDSSREQVLAAAKKAARSQTEAFEKDGFVWVGSIGLRFSDAGRLVEVQRAWSPP